MTAITFTIWHDVRTGTAGRHPAINASCTWLSAVQEGPGEHLVKPRAPGATAGLPGTPLGDDLLLPGSGLTAMESGAPRITPTDLSSSFG